jgi:hypothetical protein
MNEAGGEDMVDANDGLTKENLVQLRIAHLGMVQGVIARLSGFSANAKTFCITIVAALLAVAFDKPIPGIFWVAIAVPILFALLDAYYLAQEKRFRSYYEEIAAKPLAESVGLSLVPTEKQTLLKIGKALFSGSVAILYLAIMAALLYIAGNGPESRPRPDDRRSSEHTASAAAGTELPRPAVESAQFATTTK